MNPVYFSGHGDSGGNFHLSNGDQVSFEEIIETWEESFSRKQSNENMPFVIIDSATAAFGLRNPGRKDYVMLQYKQLVDHTREQKITCLHGVFLNIRKVKKVSML
mmetsp:Transcript_27396/g.33456  ORF Transcript_27396/g.33456 Transcript_27396/m.33456 type:complete len:105 (+) Transcript_27396:969-1283(+)